MNGSDDEKFVLLVSGIVDLKAKRTASVELLEAVVKNEWRRLGQHKHQKLVVIEGEKLQQA